MKASFINSYGGPDVLEIGEIPDPIPTKGTVLVSVKAASINPLDFKIRSGALKIVTGSKFPKVLGTDFSGVIQKLGEGVTGFKVGDSVYGAVTTFIGKQGALAELVVAPANAIRPLPDKISFEEAASLPVAALTALNGFRQCGDISGRKVLINGATGGVGHFAVQIAKARGAEVTAVCSSKNFDFAKQLGAKDLIDYSKVNILTNGIKYDVLFDAYGKLNFKEASKILTDNGYYVSTLLSPFSFFSVIISKLIGGKKLVPGNMRAKKEDYIELESLLSNGKIKPVIGMTFHLAKAKDAIAQLESGNIKGKIVVSNLHREL
jgi:NADPH:quinone reductase-like Zn-dependent oxidoreductase